MSSILALIQARKPGNEGSLRALAVALAAAVDDTPDLPTDPAEAWDAVDTHGAELRGTWQEVRAARDHGDLTAAEYEYLAAAVDALTQEADE